MANFSVLSGRVLPIGIILFFLCLGGLTACQGEMGSQPGVVEPESQPVVVEPESQPGVVGIESQPVVVGTAPPGVAEDEAPELPVDVSKKYLISGTVTGLSDTLILQNSDGESLELTSDGAFTFETSLDDSVTYRVTVTAKPAGQACYVSNGNGTIRGSDVTNVNVSCFASGALDVSFNHIGYAIGDSTSGKDDMAYSGVISSDGKILMVGNSADSSSISYNPMLMRYTSNGAVDSSFGINGVKTFDNLAGGSGDSGFSDVAIDLNGRYVILGNGMNAAGNYDPFLIRLNTDGTFDRTFGGGDGIVTHNNAAGGNGWDAAMALVIDKQGRIVVTGISMNAANNLDMVIWRFDANGNPDNTFGTAGVVNHNSAAGGNGDDFGSSVAIDEQGRIVVGGSSAKRATNKSAVVWRYLSNGTLDTSFARNGVYVRGNVAGGGGSDFINGLLIDATERIVMVGQSYSKSNDFDAVVGRLLENGSPDTSFDLDGWAIFTNIAGGNGYDSANSLVFDADGNIVVTGGSLNATKEHSDMFVLRIKDDATLDGTFGNAGVVIGEGTAGTSGDEYGYHIMIDSEERLVIVGWGSNEAANYDMMLWRLNP